ncbi:hypothetical protein TBLA_0A04390 [Henningerozyma blattae CBS 6284]|uniref:Dienelactone hydrolase domain-containing protein n=1 Tax=Henningerozyma blattae (strain ATCC 34711 / CBS 6284 / DSM 70876 / NBRC 10599 / NRRL Y-10934 / UCD 77-7) TaxID=1071380 RepID=I2GVT2_HENB6|nr:hypothetical protein TBLA_0A04390 [Tetrapisispora blattae CBS 6284]CCH58234.1 hypothetical protein TBLA_0A04390 [Tetrapisispora blattae CBS 6284]
MASNPPQACCFKGYPQTGTIQGKMTKMFGIETYVTGSSPIEDRVLVICTDVFGLQLKHNKLVADALAAGGYKVVVPDILFGDALERLDETVDFVAWREKHNVTKTRAIVDKFMEGLKKEYNPKFIGVVGYCFGAKYAIQQIHATKGLAEVAAIAHPSFVSIEEIEAIGSKKPLLISAAEIDTVYTAELRHQTEAKLKEIKAIYQQDLFGGVEHGFSIRGDESIPQNVYAKEKVLFDQLYWFDYFFKKSKKCCKD